MVSLPTPTVSSSSKMRVPNAPTNTNFAMRAATWWYDRRYVSDVIMSLVMLPFAKFGPSYCEVPLAYEESRVDTTNFERTAAPLRCIELHYKQ